jgi:hypothetical protein
MNDTGLSDEMLIRYTRECHGAGYMLDEMLGKLVDKGLSREETERILAVLVEVLDG